MDNKGEQFKTSRLLYLFVLSGVLALVFLGFTWYAFSVPSQVEKITVTQALDQNVTFNYTVMPKASTLFPNPYPLSGRDKYLTRITETIKVWIKADITSQPEIPVDGTYQVLLKLQAGDFWEKEYVLSPKKEFSGNGNFNVIDESFTIPLKDLLAFITKVEEETSVYPDKGYILNVIPVINAASKVTGEPLVNDFTAVLPFSFNQRELKPEGELKQEHGASLTSVQYVPGSVRILGADRPVTTVRFLSLILSLCLLGTAAGMFRIYTRSRQPISEAQLISRRYRLRMVTASNSSLDTSLPVIQLSSFKELLRLADERETSIIQVLDNEGINKNYYLLDGKNQFCYTASDRLPGEENAPPPSIIDRVLPGEGTTV